MKAVTRRLLTLTLLVCSGSLTLSGLAAAHGNVTPQPVDTGNLEKLGTEWRDVNPYRGNPEAIRIGHSAFAQNCARCHGIDAISGGIAPDLRMLPAGEEGDAILQGRFRNGSIRNGVTYMPPFEGILSQEAAWAIRSWLDTVHQE
ncbi:cytochrome c-550 PedF [Vogesella oryzae]|uniref:cytochrome c-550 PedF n=1 Tax=Vogesella oryzae TaxID=1735285 RepID=UPI001583C913|nr:cytochrome c-550 PedF [Vogesella oryzae]